MQDRGVSCDVDVAGKARISGKNKDRHIVSWTPQEDEILREQVVIHGTENWTCIAALFKDKTSRQCRRRWYTHLNTECKKGGWSPEEDMILCEAQKIFGNRWTEISKVVSGRTDNAVKNRFNTLRKKRAKYEISSKENDSTSFNHCNRKSILPHGSNTDVGSELSMKKIRSASLGFEENNFGNKSLHIRSGVQEVLSRSPLSILVQNVNNVDCSLSKHLNDNCDAPINDERKKWTQVPILKRDESSVTALMQQAELLTFLAQKINKDNSNQSLEDAWKELRNYLIKMGECGPIGSELSGIDALLGDIKESKVFGNHTEINSSFTTKVACPGNDSNTEENQAVNFLPSGHDAIDNVHLSEIDTASTLTHVPGPSEEVSESGNVIASNSELKEKKALPTLPNPEFNSPLQMVPIFRSVAEAIPSPKFSASERQFLLNLLGFSSPSSAAANSNPSQQPSCKRALLHSL